MTEKTECQVKKHGGKRSGSGAKPGNQNARKESPKIRITFRLDPWLVEWLRSKPKGKQVETVREALIRQHDIEREIIYQDE